MSHRLSSAAAWVSAVLSLLLVVVIPVLAHARSPQAPPVVIAWQDGNDWAQAWLDAHLDEFGVPGAALALVSGDAAPQLAAAGFVAAGSSQMVDPRMTAFGAPAFGRLLAAVAALQLESQGKLSLLAPLANLPGEIRLPVVIGEPISLAHLLTGSSGLVGHHVNTALPADAPAPSLAQALSSLPQPGRVATEAYLADSTYATALAALVIEHAAGVPYADYIETALLRPLGMDSASIAQPLPRHVASQAAPGYTLRAGKASALTARRALLPEAEGLYLSAADGAALLQALLGDGSRGSERVLAASQLPLLLEPQYRQAPGLPGVTLAFDELWLGEDRLLELTSSSAGYTCAMLLWPQEAFGMVLLYNGDVPALYIALRDALLERLGAGLAVNPAPASRLSPEYAAQVGGIYRRVPEANTPAERARLLLRADPGEELVLTVSAEGSLAMAQERDITWAQLEPGLFVDSARRRWLRLESARTGQVTRVYLNQAAYDRVPWQHSYYWQRHLGLVLMALLAACILPLVLLLIRRGANRRLSWATAILMAACALLLGGCALGLYRAYTADLALGLPVWAAWLSRIPWAAAAMAALLVALAAAGGRRGVALWLRLAACGCVFVTVAVLWYAYAWYLI